MEKSAHGLEFSAEGLSGNAKNYQVRTVSQFERKRFFLVLCLPLAKNSQWLSFTSFCRPAARWKKFMLDNTAANSNPSPTIIFQIGEQVFFIVSNLSLTNDKVKLAAKRGRHIYITPEFTKSSSKAKNICIICILIPVFFFSALKRFRRHVHFN